MKPFVALLAGYLLGSISFGYLAGKLLKGIDIRQFGSGNTGSTNIQRTLGTAPAVVVLLLDTGKGLAAVLLANALGISPTWQMLAGMAAVAGHNWPLFFRFRGGRGVATTTGVFLGLTPYVVLIGAALFVITIALTRYVSLGSIVGALSVPFTMLLFRQPPAFTVPGTILAFLIIWRHRDNIGRLLQGTEHKLGEKVKVKNEGK
ncbi:MAG: glycerol-3-phosphate 1-O-acyltransferase PlsY [Firmicutes bacterium]|nr:glycerol-3-phosphate 1-O-acyltransferase PlsY [Bacillota bacterium]